MIPQIERLNELVSNADGRLDAVMATVASVDHEAPTEKSVAVSFDRLAASAPNDLDRTGLLHHLFTEETFAGDKVGYYNPSNSLVHRVLSRRRGNPLSLASIAFEVARRLDIELSVVGLPGHVLIGDGQHPNRWFDPFADGNELDIESCAQLFSMLNPGQEFSVSMLDALDARAVSRRMLMNLRVSYLRTGEVAQLVKVLTLRANMTETSEQEQVELADMLNALGRYELAAVQREHLAASFPQNADIHLQMATRHRYRRN